MNKTAIFTEYFKAQTELEEKYGPQSIVLMMVGSFYEMYGVDTDTIKVGKTEEAHNILGMTMTLKQGQSKPNSETNPTMVGFPVYALDDHLGKLLRANYTVAIYDQYADTGSKKCRKLAHVYTPSTYIDDSITDANGVLACELVEYKSSITKQLLKKVHMAILYPSTGKLYLAEAYDTNEDVGKAESELYRAIHTFNPCEIICNLTDTKKFISQYDIGTKKVYFKQVPKEYRKLCYQNEFLNKIFKQKSAIGLTAIESVGLEKRSTVIPHLIQVLQFAYEQDKLIVNRIHIPKFIENSEQLILSGDSLYQLNLVESPFEITTTLFNIICKAKTPMGHRRVRQRLLSPITNVNKLSRQYDLIDKVRDIYKEYEENLRVIIDIEKKYRKMVLHTLHPYEFADMYGSFKAIKNLLGKTTDLFNINKTVIDEFDCFYNEYVGNFDFKLMKQCKFADIRGYFFTEGIDGKLDEMSEQISFEEEVLKNIAREFSLLIDKSNSTHVKLGRHDKEGYFMKLTRQKFNLLPKKFTVNYEYHGKMYTITPSDLEAVKLTKDVKLFFPQLKSISHNISGQRTRMNQQIISQYITVLDHYVNAYGSLFIKISNIIADIDFTYSMARVAVENGYVRPKIVDAQSGISYLKASGLRHPIIEKINDSEEYITNDVTLGVGDHYGSVIYGLNMSGKSSLLKSIGCNIVLAQAGMFVSCSNFKYFPFKNLVSKMTIRDSISKGQSTFMVEMIEVRNMLMRADPNTLILTDEFCCSTESMSGHAAVSQTLHELANKKARFMFSTHLHELQNIPLVTENNHIKIYHFKMHINGREIVYDRTIEEGGMTELYGLEVARALGLPESFIKGALAVRDFLVGEPTEILSVKKSRYNSKVYVHECASCGSTKNLHSHHIRPQKDADKSGLIDKRFHKDAKFNLRVLCEKCHKKEHCLS